MLEQEPRVAADRLEAEPLVEPLWPVVRVRDEEGEFVAGRARFGDRAEDECPREASASIGREGEDVLDLTDASGGIELRVRDELAVGLGGEELRRHSPSDVTPVLEDLLDEALVLAVWLGPDRLGPERS